MTNRREERAHPRDQCLEGEKKRKKGVATSMNDVDRLPGSLYVIFAHGYKRDIPIIISAKLHPWTPKPEKRSAGRMAAVKRLYHHSIFPLQSKQNVSISVVSSIWLCFILYSVLSVCIVLNILTLFQRPRIFFFKSRTEYKQLWRQSNLEGTIFFLINRLS